MINPVALPETLEFELEEQEISKTESRFEEITLSDIKPAKIPTPCNVEIRYTRTERATEVIAIQKKDFNRDFTYGEDAHIIKGYCENITDIKHCLLT